jgi:hypothetical protein
MEWAGRAGENDLKTHDNEDLKAKGMPAARLRAVRYMKGGKQDGRRR